MKRYNDWRNVDLVIGFANSKETNMSYFIQPNLFLVFNVELFIIPGSQRLHVYIRDFKIQRRVRQQERQINNRFYKQNNNFARHHAFLCISLPVFARPRRENA